MNRTNAILVELSLISIDPTSAQLIPTGRSVAINIIAAATTTTQLVAHRARSKFTLPHGMCSQIRRRVYP